MMDGCSMELAMLAACAVWLFLIKFLQTVAVASVVT